MERDVRAQVKLAFTSTTGVKIVCTRSMQLQLKKKTQTFKTLEGQLMSINHGERVSLNSRTAELDEKIPTYLGTSKAVLDYVVFCHQDDSLWPLAEPAVLKKRFDELFEAMKFSKALDDLKKIKKDMVIDIKLLTQSVSFLKQDKERADKTKERSEQLMEEIEQYRQDAKVIKLEIEKVTAESQRLFNSGREFNEILSRIKLLEHERKTGESNIQLEQSLVLRTESDEELESILSNFESELDSKKRDLQTQRNTYESMENELQFIRDKHGRLIGESGQLNAEAETYQKNLSKRKTFIINNSDKLKFELPNDYNNINDEHIESFKSTIRSMITKLSYELQQLVKDSEIEQSKIQSALQEIVEEKLRKEQKKISCQNNTNSTKNEIQQLQHQITQIKSDEGLIAYEKAALQNLELQMSTLKEELTKDDIPHKITESYSKLSNIDSSIENLQNELAKSNRQSGLGAKLAIINGDITNRKAAIDAMLSNNSETYKTLTGESIESETLEDDWKKFLDKTNISLSKAQDEQRIISSKVSSLEAEKEMISKQLSTSNRERERYHQEVYEALDEGEEIIEYEGITEQLEEGYKQAVENAKTFTFLVDFYNKAKTHAEQHKTCSLCLRPFEIDEIPAFNRTVDRLLKSQPLSVEEAEKQVQDAKDDLDQLKKVAPQVSRYRRLDSTEIPNLEKNLSDIDAKLINIKREFETNSVLIGELKGKLDQLEMLRTPLNNITRDKNDFKSLEAQKISIENDLKMFGITTKSSQELQQELTSLSNEARSIRNEIQKLTEEKDNNRNQLNRLENSIQEKKFTINNYEHQLQQRENLKARISDFKEKIENWKTDVNECDKDIMELQPSLDSKKHDLELIQKKYRKLEDEKTEEISNMRDISNSFGSIEQDLETYIQSRGAERLEKCKRDIDQMAQKITQKEVNVKKLGDDIHKVELDLGDAMGQERNIRDNLRLRKLKREMIETENELKELRAKNAEVEKVKYEQEAEKLNTRNSRLTASYAGKNGEIKQMDDQLSQLERELNTEYKDIHSQYKREWVKLKSTSVATEDVTKYSKALDSAIMKYHSIKMEEINRIIDELWKKTYSGTDVDSILIRSDNSGARGNQLYNYRVCMVKQDAELDMRGRCSAGQKVLASIIIRLALAECFGNNCGMIALDEPTTNLDIENIESLARSLSNIIEHRKQQNNFQLIVITHDEKFLQYMDASKYTDHYYLIRRNDRQKSEIEEVDISKISD